MEKAGVIYIVMMLPLMQVGRYISKDESMSKKCKAKLFLLLIIAMSMSSYAIDEKSIVDGAAQFLIERSQQNYLYIFEKQIKKDSLFTRYFPKTTKALSDLDLTMLLTNKMYIQENILADMENIGYVAISPTIDSAMANIVLPLKTAADTLAKYDSSFNPKFVKELHEIQKVLETRISIDHKKNSLVLDGFTSIAQIIDSCSVMDSIINSYEKVLTDPAKSAHVKGLGIAAFIGKREVFPIYVNSLIDNITQICDTNRSYTSRVVASLEVLYKLEVVKQNTTKTYDKKFFERFNKCKKYCLFFAQICDAKSPEVVKQILTSVSLPPVSFELKRQEGTSGVFINSYAGVCGGYEFGSNQGYFGLSAPIGIELTWGLSCGWSTGLFIPMIDLGRAVNSQIYNNKTPQFAEIIAPGLGITFGTPGVPLAINLIYSYGTGMRATSLSVSHVAASVAFDMPLFNLYSKKPGE